LYQLLVHMTKLCPRVRLLRNSIASYGTSNPLLLMAFEGCAIDPCRERRPAAIAS
jgi:hypothetical protein